MSATSKSHFSKVSETIEKKQERLKAQAKALDESLRKTPVQAMKLTPTGVMRRDGDSLGRQAVNKQRVDISKELEQIKVQMEERDKRDLTIERGVSRGL